MAGFDEDNFLSSCVSDSWRGSRDELGTVTGNTRTYVRESVNVLNFVLDHVAAAGAAIALQGGYGLRLR